MASQSEVTTVPVPEGTDAEITPRYANYVLGVLFVVYVFNFVDRQILAILLDPIKKDLGVSDTAMGFLGGFAFALFYTVAGIPIARIADRWVRRSVIAIGLTVWSAMTALCGAATVFWHLALARIGVGIGEAAGSPPAHSLIADYFPPERRATALAIYSMGIHFGILFGFLAGGWIGQYFGWRMAFLVVGLPGIVLAIILRLTVREPPRGHSEALQDDEEMPSTGEVFRFLWNLKSFRHMSLGAAFAAFAGYGIATWGPTFLMRVHGMEMHVIGSWLGPITGVFGGLGAFIGGVISDRLGAKDERWYLWIPAIAALAGLPAGLGFLLWPEAVPALVFFMIPSTLVGAAWLGPIFSTTQALAKLRMRALASAILLFIINIIGMGLGPQTVGILNDTVFAAYEHEAVRYSMAAVLIVMHLWATLHFALGARTLVADMRAKDA